MLKYPARLPVTTDDLPTRPKLLHLCPLCFLLLVLVFAQVLPLREAFSS